MKRISKWIYIGLKRNLLGLNMRPKLREPQKVVAKIRGLSDLNNGDLMTLEKSFDGIAVCSELDHAI